MSSSDDPEDLSHAGNEPTTGSKPWNPVLHTDAETPDWARPLVRALREGQLELDRKAALPPDNPDDLESTD